MFCYTAKLWAFRSGTGLDSRRFGGNTNRIVLYFCASFLLVQFGTSLRNLNIRKVVIFVITDVKVSLKRECKAKSVQVRALLSPRNINQDKTEITYVIKDELVVSFISSNIMDT
jgi:hypothetical protein